ncbi:MAG: ATP-binding protein [Ancalomicrobiaceae bacterium]|nr:ATP-binding protein [Ancalomicrobiaceae bacterium]
MAHDTATARRAYGSSEILHACGRLSTVLALTLLTFVWGGTYLYLKLDREKSFQATIENTANLASIFEEQVARSIKDIDKTILFLRHAYESDPTGFDLPSWTTNVYLLRDLTVQIALIGPDGKLMATNVARNVDPVDLSDREHFRVHLTGIRDTLFISKPVLGRASGKWTVQLTRRISKPDGSFGGVIVASLDPYHLSKFIEQIDLGQGGTITLIGTDGIIRARGGLNSDTLGQSIVGTQQFELLMAANKGHFFGPAVNGAGNRLVNFRHMKDFPLIVTVSESEADILDDYQNTETLFYSTASGLSIIIIIAAGMGIAHEIRLKRATAARCESERRVAEKSEELEETLEHMSQGIVMIARDGRIRVINVRARNFLSLDDDVGTGDPMPRDVLDRLNLTEPAIDLTTRELALADGTQIELQTSIVPGGGTLFTLTDITVRKRTETILAEARDRAEAGKRARTAFLATMSHEIRTPLNGVVGMTHLIEECDDPAERAHYIATMRRSASHLLNIIEDVLDVSKLESDRMVFEAVPFDIAELVSNTTEMVSPQVTEKRLSLSIEIAPDVPRRLTGDPRRLRQIILNLLGNAVKFTEAGRVQVRVDQAGPANDGNVLLRFAVEDSGIGIAPEYIGNLFQDFSQLDGSITRRFGGTGLGLAISRKLAEKMGGEISVSSQLGRGSTFTVLLPMRVEDDARGANGLSAAPRTHGDDAKSLDILLAEDSPTNALIATRFLEKMGHRVTSVGDGQAALEALDAHPFDLVFMDIMMPRMDGLSATRAIRTSGEPYADMPIIALTAATLAEDRERAFESGVDGFSTKPVSFDRLRSAIEEVMRRRGGKLRGDQAAA